MAQAGLGSRRECEQLILDGRVQVDGQTVEQLGTRVDPSKQKILVDGTRVRNIKFQYYIVNKPAGVVSTCRDPAGRVRVIDLINTDQRVYNVGRLDKSSEGLILVTNDGDLANRLTHPRYGIEKTYLVTVAGRPNVEDLRLLEQGVYLSEGFAKVSAVRIKKRRKQSTDLQIVLDEGRNREIRRLLARVGHKVTRLRRIAIGPLRLDDLPVGANRRLERGEIESLQRASRRTRKKTANTKPRKPRSLAGHDARVSSNRGIKKGSDRSSVSTGTKTSKPKRPRVAKTVGGSNRQHGASKPTGRKPRQAGTTNSRKTNARGRRGQSRQRQR